MVIGTCSPIFVYTLPITSYDCCLNFHTIICGKEKREKLAGNGLIENYVTADTRLLDHVLFSNTTVVRRDNIFVTTPLLLKKSL